MKDTKIEKTKNNNLKEPKQKPEKIDDKNHKNSGQKSQNLKNQAKNVASKSEKTQKNGKTDNKKHKNGTIIGLSIATGILGLTTLGFGIGYGVMTGQANNYAVQLENNYKKNYYELVDNVNTADMNISKLLASNNETYKAKQLGELAQGAKDMQSNIASLPLSSDNIVQSVKFINQMSGYTQILEQKISEGGTLSDEDLQTLRQMHDALTEMKRFLNRMSAEIMHGYSILDASLKVDGDYSSFSMDFAQIKADDTDYPTMIYDGPFSDSVVNQKVKGLSGAEISKEDAYKVVDTKFKNISNLKYDGQTNGKFKTYNFSLLNSDGQKLFVQTTKVGGKILTVSGTVKSGMDNISFEQAQKIAIDFAKENDVEDASVVWSEELDSQAYFNIAPKQRGIILYPDLVKVKIDMENGNVIGYDSMAYWTNHAERNLGTAKVSKESARAEVDDSFETNDGRLVLAPLDYNREVLCWEFECQRNGSTYYIYINAESGIEENILKVVETSDGSKLM